MGKRRDNANEHALEPNESDSAAADAEPALDAETPAAAQGQADAEPATESPPDDGKKTVEQWAALKLPNVAIPGSGDEFLFAAVRTWHRWPIALRLTESEFDEAVRRLADPDHPEAVKFGG